MTQCDIFGIVAGHGMRACQGGSVIRRHVGQIDVGANRTLQIRRKSQRKCIWQAKLVIEIDQNDSTM